MAVNLRYTTTLPGSMEFTGNTLGVNGFYPSTGNPAGAIGALITNDITQQVAGYQPGTTDDWRLDSSTAILELTPTVKRVAYAELMWTASTASSIPAQDASRNFVDNSINLTLPNGNTVSIAPDAATADPPLGSGPQGQYYRTANVTDIVNAAGAGAYTVSAVPAGLGNTGAWAGWALGVIYEDDTLPFRNMTLWTGFTNQNPNNPDIVIPISGFYTPATGNVDARVLLVASEGDTSGGDSVKFGPDAASAQLLSGPNNTQINFFADQINQSNSESPNVGLINTTGTFGTLNVPPTGPNVQGYRYSHDITNVGALNYLGNSEDSAVVVLPTSPGDGYFLDLLGLQIDATGIDFGDAPDTTAAQGPGDYSSLLANNGPHHVILETIKLGAQITPDPDARQNILATGDDIPAGIPDDGTTLPLAPMAYDAGSYSITETVLNNTGQVANLYAWLDFNQDGIFQTNEGFATTVASSPNPQNIQLNFFRPAGSSTPIGNTYIRVRLTTENLTNTGGLTDEDTRSLGLAQNGEVEDYLLPLTSEPFACEPFGYRVATPGAGINSNLVKINLVTGEEEVIKSDIGILANSIGYNTLDNLIYGTVVPSGELFVIDSLGNLGIYGQVPNLPPGPYAIGAIDGNGHLFVTNGNTTYYVIDVDTTSPTFGQLLDPTAGFILDTVPFGTPLSQSLGGVADWTFSSVDGNLYGAQPNGDIVRVNPLTGQVTVLTTTGVGSADFFGAAYSVSDGFIYVSGNNTGEVYRVSINGNNATGELFVVGGTSSGNDGAACLNAELLIDFGDAPDTNPNTQGPGDYRTLLASNGPRHAIFNSILLGSQITGEPDALQNATATGDDIPAGIQDDGTTLPLTNMALNATSYTINETVFNNTGQPANVYAWIDFNQNGIFETNEGVTAVVPSSPAQQTIPLTFNVPATTTLSPGNTFVRVRVTTDNLTNTGSATSEDTRSFGPASNGEVEDYLLTIEDTQIISTKTASPASVDLGDIITYTVTLTNPGTLPISNVNFTDPLPNGVTYANNLTVSAPYTGTDPMTGLTITTINPGQTVTITWQVKVDDNTLPNPNPIPNVGTVTIPTLPPTVTPPVTTPVNNANLTPTKTVDKQYANVGDEITYTITFTNTGSVNANNVVITDPIPNGTSLVAGSVNANVPFTLGSPNLTVNLTNSVAPGQAVTLTFKVLVEEVPNPNPIPNTAEIDYNYIVDPNQPPVQVNKPTNTVTTQVNNANLSPVVKTVDKNFADVGEELTYNLTFTNTGNINANNVVVTDPIPNGTSLVPGSVVVNAPFILGNPTLTVNLTNPVVPGQTINITFKVLVEEVPNPNPIPNTATVNYNYIVDPTQPPVTDEVDSNTVTTQVNNADLVSPGNFVKAVDKAFAKVGDELTYTITAKNTGNTNANNVIVTDVIPNGTEYVANSLTVDNVANGSNPETGINIGTIAPNQTKVIKFKVLVTEVPNPNPIPNQADIEYNYIVDPNQPPVDVNGSTNIVTTQINEADLVSPGNFVKSVDKEFADIGDELTYTIKITNTGNVAANNVIVKDPIPNGTSYVANSLTVDNVANGSNPEIGINIGNVNPGQTKTIVFKVLVEEIPNPNPIPNKATVTYTFIVDPGKPPVSESGETNEVNTLVKHGEIPPTGDGSPDKTADKGVTTPGDIVTYTVTATNTGNVDINNVVVEDVVPQGTQFIPGTTTINGVASNQDPNTGINVGTVGPGESFTVTFKVKVLEGAPNPLVNTATIEYSYIVDPTDPPVEKQVVSPPVEVDVVFDEIELVKSADRVGALVGDIIRYSIKATNTGDVRLDNVIVKDPLTPNLEFIGNVTIDNVAAAGNIVNGINIGTLLVGESRTISFDAKVISIPDNKVITNNSSANYTFIVSGNTFNGSGKSNDVNVNVYNPMLDVTKTSSTTVVKVGDTFKYTITATNNGDILITDVIVKDNLPSAFEVMNISLNGATVNGDIRQGINIGNLNIGETKTIVLTLKVVSDLAETYNNIATATGKVTTDPNKPPSEVTGDGEDETGVDVYNPKLDLVKSVDKEYAVVGDILTFTIVATNTGDLPLGNVEVEPVFIYDILSPDLDFIEDSVTVSGATLPGVDIISGVNIGTLAVGESKTITFKAEVVDNINTPIKNTATATFGYQIPGLPPEIGESESNEVVVNLFRASLVVEKTSSPKFVVLGDIITYTVKIINNGDLDAKNVIFTDVLPPGVELVNKSFKVDGIVINSVNLTTGVNIGNIPKGTTKIVEYKVKVINPNCNLQIVNSASVTFIYTLPNNTSGSSQSNKTETSTTTVELGITNFKQISLEEYLHIPSQKPDIESINIVNGNVDIVKCHVIKTSNTTSTEGQYLSGFKLIIHGVLNQTVEYTACEESQSVHSAQYNIPFSTFIVLPDNYEIGNKIEVEGIVEDIYYNVVNCRVFFTNATVLINAKMLFC